MKVFFSKFNRALGKTEEVSIGIALLASTLLITVNVILRFVFKAGLVWSDETVRYLMIYITFVGCSVCVRSDNHLAVDILPMLLKGKPLKVLRIIINIICIAFSVMITYFGFLLVGRALRNPQITAGLKIPMFLPYMSIIIGFGLMSIRYLQDLIGKLRGKSYFKDDRRNTEAAAVTDEGGDA